MVLPSLWLMILGARTNPSGHKMALSFAILLIVAASLHDYLFLRGLTSVMDRYWVPFASPPALLIFAWSVLLRLLSALASIETQAGELEAKVAERTRELEAANAAKTRFIAAASHDLRQPVVSIGLLTELMREQALPAALVPILARIGDSVQALNALLKGLLDLSRFDAGAVEVRPARIALRLLMERVIGDEVEAARRKGLALRHRARPVDVHADPLLLEQILRNLVGNAVRYTHRGGVLVSARRRGTAHVLLQVWDTGAGIPPESKVKVFDEFVQLGNDARGRAGGLGLGLSLVRRAASLMGASVELRSIVGRGSCFSVELPLASPDSVRSVAAPAEESGLRGRKVWVVEDDTDVREALCLRLGGWGATVHEFEDLGSVRRAIRRPQLELPDLLVSDQRLPDGEGIEAAQLLRTSDATLAVLLVTGDTSPADIAHLRASGLPVLHKPFTSDELLTAVRALQIDKRPAPRD
jgi:signal transduction histidine kinase/CheY-like chemotaxis protein